MTQRLATIWLATMLLIGVSSLAASAQDLDSQTLKDISALNVLVESLGDGAKLLGLTRESIGADIELKLRLAGMRVLTDQESHTVPDMPLLYVQVGVTDDGVASCVHVELKQNAVITRNGQPASFATTWDTSRIGLHMKAQDIRATVKDLVDQFLNAWLSVNPKK